MLDNKLEQDEAQRIADYQNMRSNVSSNVGREVAAEAAITQLPDNDTVGGLAAEMKQKAARDIVRTDQEVTVGRFAARISQVVDYVFFIIYGLLIIRLLLELLAARESAGFFQFIKSATGLFYAPFKGLVPSPSTPEGFTLALPIIIAIVVYGFLHLAINRLLQMLAHRKTEI